MSDATFYKYKAKFSGMEVNEARRLRDLEDENRRLKKLVADLILSPAVLRTADFAKSRRSAGLSTFLTKLPL